MDLALQVALALSAASPAIDVTLTSERIEPGATQTAVVSGLDRGDDFHAAWIDPTGRVRASWEARAGRRGERAVAFRTPGALPGRHRLVAWCAEGENEARAEKSFEVLPGEPPAFLAVLDLDPDGLPRELAARELAAGSGAAALISPGPRRPAASLGWVVRILEGGPPYLRPDERRLHEPSSLVGLWRWARPRAEEAALARPWLWSLGAPVRFADEDGQPDSRRSEHTVREFVRWLTTRHAGLGSLNRRWGTAFARWDDVRAPTARELPNKLRSSDPRTARGTLAAWSDYRSFLDGTWREQLSCLRELLRSADGRARVGLEGVGLPGAFTDADPARLLGTLDWVEVAPRRLDMALARSFAPAGCRVLTRLEGDDAAAGLLRGFVNGHAGAILRANRPPGASLGRALELVGGGAGALLARTTQEHDPVLVFYSHRSVRIGWALETAFSSEARATAESGPDVPAALAAWAALLSDVGIGARFVDSEHLARRGLRGLGARVLILPRAYLISRAELAEIVHFARAGGLVVADAWAGLLDESFEAGPRPALGDLFGIARPAARRQAGARAGLTSAAPEGAITVTGADMPGAYVDGVETSPLRLAEPGVRASGGYALARGPDGTAGLVTNPCGRGRGVYLNLDLEGYARPAARPSPEQAGARGSNEAASLRRLVRNVLELAQVRPRVEVASRGEPLDGCERHYRRLEETEVTLLWRHRAFGEGKVEAELVFAGPGYCYDVLDGVLLGHKRRIRARLSPGAHVFARLPYDVESISIRASARGGEIRYRARVETSTGFAGTHLLHQEIVDASGRPIPGGGGDLIAERGVATGAIALALNEPAGSYGLLLRDAATGVEGELFVTKADSPLGKRFPLRKEPEPETP